MINTTLIQKNDILEYTLKPNKISSVLGKKDTKLSYLIIDVTEYNLFIIYNFETKVIELCDNIDSNYSNFKHFRHNAKNTFDIIQEHSK